MEKFIIIKDCTKDELKTILNDWLVMDVEGFKSKLVFEIAEIKPNVFILKIDKSIDDTDFFYLVNYFAYPIDFTKTFEVAGYATATKHKTLQNKKIYVFLNEQDTEYDNVWVTTEDNVTYKFDFGGKFKKMNYENEYKALDISNLSIIYEQITINKNELLEEQKRKEDEKSKRNLEKRFKIISTILFVVIPSVFLMNKFFPYFQNEMLMYSFAAALTLWFIEDYKNFYDIKRTLICVLLSLLSFCFYVKIQNTFITTLATIPLSTIIVMLFAIKIFKEKLDYIEKKLDKLFFLLVMVLSVLISVFVFTPILKLLK